MKWRIIVGIIIVGLGYWFVRAVTTPVPGQAMPDQGRKHVSADEMAKFTYNSNPPTSGPHLETWVKPGIYTTPQIEGELLHSLEHGYIEISYNCNAGLKTQNGKQNADNTEASGSAVNTTDTCKQLVSQLETIARKKKLFKLVVVPRPGIDAPIALTAWTYIDKLTTYNEKRIVSFIDYHRDHGPEQTME